MPASGGHLLPRYNSYIITNSFYKVQYKCPFYPKYCRGLVVDCGQLLAHASRLVVDCGQLLAHASRLVVDCGQLLAHASWLVVDCGQLPAHASRLQGPARLQELYGFESKTVGCDKPEIYTLHKSFYCVPVGFSMKMSINTELDIIFLHYIQKA